MSVEIREVEDLVDHYRCLLEECDGSQLVVEGWGLKVEEELEVVDKVRGVLLDLLVKGVEVI